MFGLEFNLSSMYLANSCACGFAKTLVNDKKGPFYVLNYSQRGIFYYVSTSFGKSHEKSHRLWTKNQSLVRGRLALLLKIPLRIQILENILWTFFWYLWLHPPGHPSEDSQMALYGWDQRSGAQMIWLCCKVGHLADSRLVPAPSGLSMTSSLV